MAKVPGKVGFTQKTTPKTAPSTKKNAGKVGFDQPTQKAGKTSSKKNPGKVGFTQKTAAKTAPSTKKNPGKVGFDQKSTGSTKTGVSYSAKPVAPPAGKTKKAAKVAPKMKSLDDVKKFAKKKYGI